MSENNQVVEKAYVFRKLKASDIPYMTNLLKKIGLNKMTSVLKNENIVGLLKGNDDENFNMIAGGAIFLEIAQIILEGAGDCEELYALLSETSNLSIDEVKDLDLDVFFNMIVDFVKKDEFMGFFKGASKYLTAEN